MSAADIAHRLWRRVRKTDGCWEWLGAKKASGHGMIGAGGRGAYVHTHRLAYELEVGPIPAGMCVCHRCDNPSCVRPNHLFLGTQADNVRDMVAKGRMPRGERRGHAKLTADKVRQIRADLRGGERQHVVARAHGVSQTAISLIVRGRNWSHVQ